MSGVHIGIIVLMNRLQLNDVVQCVVPMVYWGLVAAVITFVTRKQIRDSYDEPMHKLAEATKKVANGDFSVYMPTCHTADKLDYLDRMILDFNKMVEELGSIETLKTDFVSNVSHEMKTPIAIIKNYAEMLQAEEVSRERRMEYAAAMEDASIRLSSLISNILKLNRLENQRITPEVEVYDVCRQLCDCILPFEEVWEARRIEMEIDLEDEAMVLADQSLLELVWNNLLSNALKFTEPGGTVTVRQISEDGYVKIFVADTGCGMKKESIRHIFDKFYQGDTSHAKEGNGLGLALVKRVLELLNGDIHVTSEEGVGSTFTVVLPAVQNETMEEPGNGGE
ncbi:MAG: HAMP domain-containing histidine kinase [Lachnospiraceae bacterium]|nr:HAMP domain-containing histidine kinase [Lachnospiraceae bacterium]